MQYSGYCSDRRYLWLLFLKGPPNWIQLATPTSTLNMTWNQRGTYSKPPCWWTWGWLCGKLQGFDMSVSGRGTVMWAWHSSLFVIYKWTLNHKTWNNVTISYCFGVDFWINRLCSVEEAWWSIQDCDCFVFFQWSHSVMPKSWLVWCSNDTSLCQPIYRGSKDMLPSRHIH